MKTLSCLSVSLSPTLPFSLSLPPLSFSLSLSFSPSLFLPLFLSLSHPCAHHFLPPRHLAFQAHCGIFTSSHYLLALYPYLP